MSSNRWVFVSAFCATVACGGCGSSADSAGLSGGPEEAALTTGDSCGTPESLAPVHVGYYRTDAKDRAMRFSSVELFHAGTFQAYFMNGERFVGTYAIVHPQCPTSDRLLIFTGRHASVTATVKPTRAPNTFVFMVTGYAPTTMQNVEIVVRPPEE